MIRLNNNILLPVQQVMCDTHCVSVALLNIRSIGAKLPDVVEDKTLICATIQCFVRPNQIDIRCDRVTCENKGGIMICVTRQLHPSDTQRFAANGIEAVCCMLILPNLTWMQIALVYRSPSVSQRTFRTVLSRLLRHMAMCNTPCLVLGDFNEDLLHQLNYPNLSFMSEHGFRQLVKSPPTHNN